jgi:hypothetical protein
MTVAPRLRARVLAAIRPWRSAIEPPRLWMAGLAATAALVLVLAGVTLVQFQRIRTLVAHMAALSSRLAAQERALAVLARSTSRTAVLQGSVQANVRFVYDRATGQGALLVADLPDPGTGFVYQVWLVDGQESENAGVFRPIPGQPIVIPVNADFRRYQAIAISVEHGPNGSPTGETSLPILVGTI